VESVVGDLGGLAAEYPGAWIEDKPLGLTLHYCQVAASQREGLLARAGQLLQAYAGCLRVVEGPMAWEVTPAVGADKGSAIRLILESVGPPVLPFYAGDGANDEEAVLTTVALGGVALGVGACAPPSAPYRLPDPAALAHFLTKLVESLPEGA
jgi:trehalose-phosphatase